MWSSSRNSCLTIFLTAALFIFFVALETSGQPSGPRVIASRDFSLLKESEVGLEIKARAKGASWARAGGEAPALLIEVDGQYSQDLLLWAGDSGFVYRVILGRLAAGGHQVTVRLNQAHSALGAQQATVLSMRPVSLTRDSHHTAEDLLAIMHAPVLSQRPNTIDRFSDLPILTYYEVSHPSSGEVQVRYTTIFTNEDGGTPTAALMARWGRASDIEWVYEFRARDGQVVEELYQGVSHEPKPFKGSRIGTHPLLAVASDNNNFSDQITSNVRFALFPIAVDLRDSTRESAMDQNPWTYRIVAEELAREGKLQAVPADANSIADPRNYVYVDLHAVQKETAISVEVRSSKQENASPSDRGDVRLRIERSGYFRTAIQMTSAESATAVSSVTVRCHSNAGQNCEGVQVSSVSVLNRHYSPRFYSFKRVLPKSLKPNETLTLKVR
jgi:hypothetical protein